MVAAETVATSPDAPLARTNGFTRSAAKAVVVDRPVVRRAASRPVRIFNILGNSSLVIIGLPAAVFISRKQLEQRFKEAELETIYLRFLVKANEQLSYIKLGKLSKSEKIVIKNYTGSINK